MFHLPVPAMNTDKSSKKELTKKSTAVNASTEEDLFLPSSPIGTCILATCVRNEGPYLLEWYCHHKNLGFDHFVVYSNDNTDGSDLLLRELEYHGLIDWHPQQLGPKDSPQLTAYQDLSNKLLNKPNDQSYLLWLDPDEFLVLKQHRYIQEMIQWYNFPDGIALNWKHFGGSGLIKFSEELTIKRFLLCSKDANLNCLTKTMCRIDPNLYTRINNHRPQPKKGTKPRIMYATEDRKTLVPDFIVNGGDPRDTKNRIIAHEICQLNHYSIRSKQEFSWKKSRGNGRLPVNDNGSNFLESYWKARDLNTEIDDLAHKKYTKMIELAVSDLPNSILQANEKINKRIITATNKSNSAEDSKRIQQEVATVKYLTNNGTKHVSFKLDLSSFTNERRAGLSIGGVAVSLTGQKIKSIRLVDFLNRSVEAQQGYPSPAANKAYKGNHNSSEARFKFTDVPFILMRKAKIVISLEDGSETIYAEISVDKKKQATPTTCLPRYSHLLDFRNMAEIIRSQTEDKKIFYIANRGNYGDSLIRHGALSFFHKFGIEYREYRKESILNVSQANAEDLSDKVCIYGGSGAWCKVTPGASSIVYKLSQLFKKVIVLPSTYEIKPVHRRNLMLWSRGGRESYVNSSGYFCHDMAFMLGSIKCRKGYGDGYFYRTDKEASGLIRIPENNHDLSMDGNAYSNPFSFFDCISCYARIYTDRLHIAIAGALMDKVVHLTSSSYFKTREIYDSSIKGFFDSVYFYE